MNVQKPRSIDLNADVGEGYAVVDEQLMPLVTSANIACGGHAGDDDTMAQAVAVARRHGVAIGAHPGHVDREQFGRGEIPITPEAAAALVSDQVSRLSHLAGEPPRHVKLHGGLYHQVARDRTLAEAVAEAIANQWPSMIVVAPARSLLVETARARGLRVAAEAFLDRAYATEGSLVPRFQSGAVIADPSEAARRAVRLARDRLVEAIDGTLIAMNADTLCIHGDGPNPVAVAKTVRAALEAAGIAVQA